MESEVKALATNSNDSDASDWSRRTLCRDESCIGVIGADGRCKECGKTYTPSAVGAAAPVSTPPPAVLSADPPAATAEPPDFDEEWENRRLCSDESCIGVIGADGRCRECGKPFGG